MGEHEQLQEILQQVQILPPGADKLALRVWERLIAARGR